MAQKNKPPLVFFNASVILSGLKSPQGGSAKLLSWVKQQKIKGVISELVLDETNRNLKKLSLTKKPLNKISAFLIQPAPPVSLVEKYQKVVLDYGDTHLLASAKETKADYLVSLDKKHVLVLKNKTGINILSPKQLISKLT